MIIASTKDDRLLQWITIAVGQEPLKQMFAHRRDSFRENKFRLQSTWLALNRDIVCADTLTSQRIRKSFPLNIRTLHTSQPFRLNVTIMEQVVGFQGRWCEISVGNSLHVFVFVRRLAKVLEIVGQQSFVAFNLCLNFRVFAFRQFDFSRCCRQPDLNRFGILFQNHKPVAPSRPMTFVDHDDVKVIGWIMFAEEVWICILFFFVIVIVTSCRLVHGLVRSNQYPSILLWLFGADFCGVVAKRCLKVAESIVSQFSPIANEKSPSHQPGIEHSFEERCGDTSFARTGCQRQQDARCFSGRSLTNDLFNGGANRCVLIVAEVITPLCIGREQCLQRVAILRQSTSFECLADQ